MTAVVPHSSVCVCVCVKERESVCVGMLRSMTAVVPRSSLFVCMCVGVFICGYFAKYDGCRTS